MLFDWYQYSAVQLGSSWLEESSNDSKISKAGYASTNGALLALFKRFGKFLRSTDYSNFIPSVSDPAEKKEIIPAKSAEKI